MVKPLSPVRGTVLLAAMGLGIIATFSALLPCVLLLPLARWPAVAALRQSMRTFANQAFFQYCSWLLINFCGTTVQLHFEDASLLGDEQMFIISNHRCTIDWMFSGWCYATFLAHYPCLIFLLKESLRSMPFFGYCAQIIMYMFLSRHKDKDLPHIARLLAYWRAHSKQLAIIMFPEGTDLSSESVERSHAYSREKGLQLLHHVLHPRPAGFLSCVRYLQEHMSSSMVLHDITVAYKDCIPGRRTTASSLFRGEFPLEVHLHVRRHKLSDIPNEDAKIDEWLRKCFLDKEALLESFYNGDNSVATKLFPHSIAARTNAPAARYVACMLLLMLLALYVHFTSFSYNVFYVVYSLAFAVLPTFGGFEGVDLAMSGY